MGLRAVLRVPTPPPDLLRQAQRSSHFPHSSGWTGGGNDLHWRFRAFCIRSFSLSCGVSLGCGRRGGIGVGAQSSSSPPQPRAWDLGVSWSPVGGRDGT